MTALCFLIELNSTEENVTEFECNMNGTQMSSSVTNEYSESETLSLPISEAEVMTASCETIEKWEGMR